MSHLYWQRGDLESIRIDSPPETDEEQGTSWMLLSRDAEFFDLPPLAGAASPNHLNYDRVRLWTDDYTSLLPLLEFNRWRDHRYTTRVIPKMPHDSEE